MIQTTTEFRPLILSPQIAPRASIADHRDDAASIYICAASSQANHARQASVIHRSCDRASRVNCMSQ
jgi:hypothetical protein